MERGRGGLEGGRDGGREGGRGGREGRREGEARAKPGNQLVLHDHHVNNNNNKLGICIAPYQHSCS